RCAGGMATVGRIIVAVEGAPLAPWVVVIALDHGVRSLSVGESAQTACVVFMAFVRTTMREAQSLPQRNRSGIFEQATRCLHSASSTPDSLSRNASSPK